MRILITGVDGYIGWALSMHLALNGHEVAGIDDYSRRRWVGEMGSQSAIPIAPMAERLSAYRKHIGQNLRFYKGDLTDYNFVLNAYKSFQPEAIVYLGEMPSAPYSMVDVHHAVYTQQNNIIGTLNTLFAMREVVPECHLVKLGTMGEYGTPNVDIPEGFFEIEYRGRKDKMMFPRKAGSWYHQSKVHDTNNVEMACRIWGLRSTDIMQGVVYGTQIDDMPREKDLKTRFDFDQSFGTAINRFCAQAVIGIPITPYGLGKQKRGFIPLRDSVQCLTIATENPPQRGEYRVFNQFEEVYSIMELAQKVQKIGNEFDLNATIQPLENPREEMEEHYYNPDHDHFLELGYKPTRDMDSELRLMFKDLLEHKDRIEERKEAHFPDIRWDGSRRKSSVLK
ncbi:MAG: NAD-dependent epimerase/dehydratase family protein [Candidatus Dadabacteria bacterium]|nr:NAD-dependent epimerase/dehydratase family protein [Candidatus Dadabacteria bacterium]NIS08034.1 NAD-dependent epimerase/dehydratase family protein [Candidatus Dadabacteria bacterium]NIV40857.1 NAD-dependent epimerase/dehydratase family protein [Candidatus Dadabacteria bacterium]NIY21612.1 NAD-dependent epimerase/dehydratase family protein [Candidatus Dadabacteria bacterium]